jgi:hypothetical protein
MSQPKLTYHTHDLSYTTRITLKKANGTNYDVHFLINSLLNDKIEKKINIKKYTIKQFEFTRVNLHNP